MKYKLLLLFLFFLSLPTISHACAVCFGGTDANLSRGFFWGIVVLGLLPFAMLTGFIGAIVRSTRKKNKSHPI